MKRVVDNGNTVTTKREVEDVIIEPMYYGDTGKPGDIYEVISNEEYEKMTEEEVKEWYKSRRKGK